MIAYPKELRVRVVAAVEQGEHSIPEIASLFGVGITFAKKMLRRHRAGEELALLCTAIKEQPDATLGELQTVLVEQAQLSVSPSTICRALQRLNLPRKKKSDCR
jgi:transposase